MILKAINSTAPLSSSLEYAERKASKMATFNLRHEGMAFEEMKIVQLHYGKSNKKKTGKKNSKYPGFHFVLSCAPGEVKEAETVLDMAKEFITRCEKLRGHQIELCLHEDRDHIHVHIIGNPVNRETGKVLHVSREEYREMIAIQQQIGVEHGILPVEKGEYLRGDFVTANQKKNEVVRRKGVDSDLVKVYQAVVIARHNASNWDEFIAILSESGISVERRKERRHLVFAIGKRRFRDSNLSRTFTDSINKEELENEFLKNSRLRTEEYEYDRTRKSIIADLEHRKRELSCLSYVDTAPAHVRKAQTLRHNKMLERD